MNRPLTFSLPSRCWRYVAGALAADSHRRRAAVWGRKGSVEHRVLGWAWSGGHGGGCCPASGSAVGIPHIAGFSPIHLLTLLVLVSPAGRDARAPAPGDGAPQRP
ncbi:MAG: hypothetical protein IPQ21_18720 [Betaproteobacteria bacterium]|nr:hypothetical protein [Betaproteobacteria bacterium]